LIKALRIPLRIAAVCAIVLLCGAYSCLGPEGDIAYAPGYGYVVKIRKNPPIFSPNSATEDYFIWFKTEEEARDFIGKVRGDDPYTWNDKFHDKIKRGEGVMDDEDNDDDLYSQILKLLRPLPPPPPPNPLATPDLPQPIPPTPQ
jgi:hypothetical protein